MYYPFSENKGTKVVLDHVFCIKLVCHDILHLDRSYKKEQYIGITLAKKVNLVSRFSPDYLNFFSEGTIIDLLISFS